MFGQKFGIMIERGLRGRNKMAYQIFGQQMQG